MMELLDGWWENLEYGLVLEEAEHDGRLSGRLVFNSFGIPIGSDSSFVMLPTEDVCGDLSAGEDDLECAGSCSTGARGGLHPREDLPELLL